MLRFNAIIHNVNITLTFSIVQNQLIGIIFASNKQKQLEIMKVTKITKGLYKVVDAQGTWLAVGPNRNEGGYWNAYDCDKEEDCSNDTNWGVGFKTFAQLKKYSQSF